ncbi:MAG: hypothetical protein RR049_06775, partial [Angelakisella sp.]
MNDMNEDIAPKKRRRKKRGSPVMRFIAGTIMVCTILGCIAACYLTVFVFDVLESSDVIELDLDLLKLNYTTIIYAEDTSTGEFKELQRLEGDSGSRVWVDYENMPPQLFDTLIAVEDKRF